MMPTLRIAIPLATVMLLSPLAAAQTPSPQTPPTAPAASSFSAGQRTEIEGIVKNYLVAHPEVLQQAMDALDKQQKQADAEKVQATIKNDNATLFDSPHQVVLGNPQGSEQVVEFFDYNCAFCKRALPDMLTLLKTDPNLKFVLKEFPVLGPGSVEAAHVAVAARMQDRLETFAAVRGKTVAPVLRFPRTLHASSRSVRRPAPPRGPRRLRPPRRTRAAGRPRPRRRFHPQGRAGR